MKNRYKEIYYRRSYNPEFFGKEFMEEVFNKELQPMLIEYLETVKRKLREKTNIKTILKNTTKIEMLNELIKEVRV